VIIEEKRLVGRGGGVIFRTSGVVAVSMTWGLIQVDDDPESETDVLGTLPQSGELL
jgi:hypothetical protein